MLSEKVMATPLRRCLRCQGRIGCGACPGEAASIVDFFRKKDEVERLKKNIKRRIVDSSFDDPEIRTAVMGRFMELARVKFNR